MSKPHTHPASTPAAGSSQGKNRVRGDFDPGFSFLRSSLASRLLVVAVCAGVLWAAVFAVIA
ncbi:hypothetical protein [Aquabacter cavernae]|uniref:hypothetical protein n=1 Tax=Aquabacter cavernae TaxID=2496029 RepID=UPI000F8F4FC0|nr:hypothetical protein [Aquabacter cavernae]